MLHLSQTLVHHLFFFLSVLRCRGDEVVPARGKGEGGILDNQNLPCPTLTAEWVPRRAGGDRLRKGLQPADVRTAPVQGPLQGEPDGVLRCLRMHSEEPHRRRRRFGVVDDFERDFRLQDQAPVPEVPADPAGRAGAVGGVVAGTSGVHVSLVVVGREVLRVGEANPPGQEGRVRDLAPPGGTRREADLAKGFFVCQGQGGALRGGEVVRYVEEHFCREGCESWRGSAASL